MRAEPFDKLRTGLSKSAIWPFDRLRAHQVVLEPVLPGGDGEMD